MDSKIEQFVAVLGATVDEVEPGDRCSTGRCAEYERATKTLTVCRQLCPGQRDRVWAKVLSRI